MVRKITGIELLILKNLAKRYAQPSKELKAMVLAQLNYESLGFTKMVEDFRYSPQRLLEIFPKYFSNKDVNYYAGNPEKIANKVYANRYGNGVESSGDGWRYRGRGFIQLTFKNNYDKFLPGVSPQELETDRDLNIKVSIDFLLSLNSFIQAAGKKDVYTCTKLINGGLNGLKERTDLFDLYLSLL